MRSLDYERVEFHLSRVFKEIKKNGEIPTKDAQSIQDIYILDNKDKDKDAIYSH